MTILSALLRSYAGSPLFSGPAASLCFPVLCRIFSSMRLSASLRSALREATGRKTSPFASTSRLSNSKTESPVFRSRFSISSPESGLFWARCTVSPHTDAVITVPASPLFPAFSPQPLCAGRSAVTVKQARSPGISTALPSIFFLRVSTRYCFSISSRSASSVPA